METFGKYKDFKFPKFFNMSKYSEDIAEFGDIGMYNTGPKERFNITLRQAYLRTNRKPGTLGQQVRQEMQYSFWVGMVCCLGSVVLMTP